jgi:hypothetical protein
MSISSHSPDDFRRVSFQSARTRGAAVLFLPTTTRREDTIAQGDFGRWIVTHIGSWLAFARKLGLGIEEMEEIILVTGCDRTRSWTNIAFLGGEVDAQVSFGVKVDGPSNDNINFQLSPLVRGAVIDQGPEGTVCCAPFETVIVTNLIMLLCLLEPARESMCISPRISCRSFLLAVAKAFKRGRGFSRFRGLWL